MSNFYYRGKFFETEEEFLNHVNQWLDLPLDIVELKNELSMIFEEAECNKSVQGDKYTNKYARQLIAERYAKYL